MRKKNQILKKLNYLIVVAFLSTFLTSCDDDIADVGSIADLTPPTSNFTFEVESAAEFLKVTFSNTSTSSTDYLWDFGDGETSTELEPIHTYPAEGTYTVVLTSSDKLGVISTSTMEVTLVDPMVYIPPIKEGGFEENDLFDGTGDGRDSWRNSSLGGTIQITTDPVQEGLKAAKLTGDPSSKRIGYQLLTVSPNTVYELTFYYTMKNDQTGGFLTVSILDGPVTSHAEALSSTIGTVTVRDQSDPDTYVKETVAFDSGSNTEVAIYFFNEGSVETRLDNFSMDLGSGTVPPVSSFSFEVDSTAYNTINFTNTSSNATSYSWSFGDGNSSLLENPTHTFTTDGTYTVRLTARNSEGESSSSTAEIEIKMPSPYNITNPSFDDEPVRDDNRIAWRNSALEADADNFFGSSDYVMQTSSTARTGAVAGKLPTVENSSKPRRWIYQAITVAPNKNYVIKGWIRNKAAAVGSTVTFEIYDAPFNTASTIGNSANILSSQVFNASTGHDTDVWTEATITFNSGSSSEVVLFMTNDPTLTTTDSESFFDDFSIEEL